MTWEDEARLHLLWVSDGTEDIDDALEFFAEGRCLRCGQALMPPALGEGGPWLCPVAGCGWTEEPKP